jgi:integrase
LVPGVAARLPIDMVGGRSYDGRDKSMGGHRANGPAPAPEGVLPMQHESTAPRRVRYERGIYARETPSGRRYEITYTDSTGRQRWQVIVGGLREARAVRADIVSKLARGEHVAPSKLALREIAEVWLEGQLHLRRRTLERYETVLRLHILPHLGRRRVAAISEEDVASLIRELQAKGLSGATIRKTVMVLGRILSHATRRGLIPFNAVARLERGERPRVERREMRVLERHEIGALLDAGDAAHRPLLATAIFCGLRLGELLGLTWADIDFNGGLIYVRQQLDRDGQRVQPKTPHATREVVLMPALARILREHRLSSPFKTEHDPVFASSVGTPMHYRNVSRRGLGVAVKQAGLNRGLSLEPSLPRLAAHVRLPVDRRGRECRVRLASARPCLSGHHAQGVRAPVRQGRPR